MLQREIPIFLDVCVNTCMDFLDYSTRLWKSISHVPVFVTPWNSPDQNTGVGSRFLLLGIFPTQGSNPGLLHCGWILFQLNHQGSPGILEWVDYPFCSGTSRPRSQTGVSCIAGRFFTSWATREDPMNVGVGHKHSDHCRWEEQGFSFCQWPSCVSIRDVIVKDQANSWTGLE